MALNEAVESYHRLLTPALAEQTAEALNSMLELRGLFFGDRPLSSVLRPRFLHPEQYRFLGTRVAILLRAFDKAYQRAMNDATFREQFALYDWEEKLIAADPGFRDPSPLSRLDAFFVHERGGLRFTEYNAETPAGASYNDVLSEVFLGLPVMREYLRTHEVRPLSCRHNVLHALLDAYAQFSGSSRAPRIAIVDWPDVPTYSEFVITQEYFQRQGLECVIVEPAQLEYSNGKLTADGSVIDLVYKRVLIHELIEQGGIDHPLVRAVQDRAVCMVNPFRCKILHKKLSLAVLSDERNAELFNDAEMDAITAHIPWTRRVEERKTAFRGQAVDLLPFIVENREHFVLKPNDEYGGKGIVLGWEVDSESWNNSVRAAVNEPFIVQERVSIPSAVFPFVSNGSVQFGERILDTAPFVFYGRYMDGCLTRLSTQSLVNVTAGGGSNVPTFIVMRR